MAATGPVSALHVTIQAASGDVLASRTVATTTGDILLDALPMASAVLVSVLGVGADQSAVPGSLVRTVGALGPGANVLPLSPEADVAGAIVSRLLALDQAGASVTRTVDFEALPDLVASWQRALGAPEASLLSAEAIGTAWHGAGAPPAVSAAFFPRPARLVLEPVCWPEGISATVVLSTSASRHTVVDGRPVVIAPLPPGTWTLAVETTVDGLLPSTYTVALQVGETRHLPIGFGGPTTLQALAQGRGGAGYGVVPTAFGSETLLVIGGVLDEEPGEAPDAPTPATSAIAVGPATASAAPGALPQGTVFPASTAHGGYLYWFGGRGTAGPLAASGRFDLRTGALEARAAKASRVWGAACAALGGMIYVIGGVDGSGDATAAVQAYDPGLDAWATATLPALPQARMFPAAVALGDALYVLGGGRDGAFGTTLSTTTGYTWRPGIDTAWRALPPAPTSRLGAGAVAANGTIWLVGGATHSSNGSASEARLSRAVEVFDPTTGQWSRRASLAEARAFPAVGLVDGQLLVAGGLLGTALSLSLAQPVGTVERLRP